MYITLYIYEIYQLAHSYIGKVCHHEKTRVDPKGTISQVHQN